MDTTNPIPPFSLKWYQVWLKVFLHPSVDSFLQIQSDPRASLMRAFLWVAATGTAADLLRTITAAVYDPKQSEFIGCSPIIGSLLGMLILLLASLPSHYAAGGDEKAKNAFLYNVAAIIAPAALLYGLLIALAQLLAPVSGLIPLGIHTALAAFLGYLLGLFFFALKAAENIETGKALKIIGVPFLLLIPAALILFYFRIREFLAPYPGLDKLYLGLLVTFLAIGSFFGSGRRRR
jgi:hypothetical protein